jgi:hypothetical protein
VELDGSYEKVISKPPNVHQYVFRNQLAPAKRHGDDLRKGPDLRNHATRDLVISIRLTTGYWCRISIARYWWRASRQDEFRRGDAKLFQGYVNHLSCQIQGASSYLDMLLDRDFLVFTYKIFEKHYHSIWYSRCAATKMFIPHIPVVSSPLSPPGYYILGLDRAVAELRLELNSGGKKDKTTRRRRLR